MSVASGNGVIIFCEGKEESLDYRLLDRLVLDLDLDPRPTIVPSGSKFDFSAFSRGYFSSKEITNQKYIIFRDRDFDIKPISTIQLLELPRLRTSQHPIFLSYRSCIENYLLEPNQIDQYWQERYSEKLENNSNWGHGDSPGIEIITTWIEEAARNLQFYQAVRWALGDLTNISAAKSHLKTTWTKGSGQLPTSLTPQFCRDEAIKLINNFLQAASGVTIEKFETQFAYYQKLFDTEAFWKNQQYLVWFNGKDILKEMARQRSGYPPLTGSKSRFPDWAIQKFNLDQHPDLLELRAKIEMLGRPNTRQI